MAGFNIPGKVLEGSNGKPLVKAKIVLNGKPAGVTNDDGSFVLEKIKAGSHKIYIEAGKKELITLLSRLWFFHFALHDLSNCMHSSVSCQLSKKVVQSFPYSVLCSGSGSYNVHKINLAVYAVHSSVNMYKESIKGNFCDQVLICR